MTAYDVDATRTQNRGFWLALLSNFVFMNLSEVFRYFVFVMPMMREAFPQVANIAPMNLLVFASWGIWDTVLIAATTGIIWLFMDRFGNSVKNAILSGTLVWATVFVLLWLGLYNMNLATLAIVAIALPFAWLELVIAGFIILWARRRAM